jgi:hypothetical protein
MEDLGSEEHLGWDHGIFIWQVKFSMEHSSFVGSSLGTSDLHEEVSVVALAWLGVNTNNY